jgi:lipopolysaccharide biosynthesis glycosyltransferase
MTQLHLACASDQRYVPHSAAMLHSALAHAHGRPLRVHYLCSADFPERSRRLLTAMVERCGGTIAFHCIPEEWVSGMPAWEYIGTSMWYRLFLPQLVTDSLEPLWSMDLSDSYVAAVTNVFELHQVRRPEQLGLPGPPAYFNSGVLLMNLDAMRAHECTETLVRFARKRAAELLWPDQDTLNVVLGVARLRLHPRWNCMNSILTFPWSDDVFGPEVVEEARKSPGIRHFEGPAHNKPWHYMCDAPARDLYFAHRRDTPWPNVRLEGRTPGNVARRWWRHRTGRHESNRLATATLRA